MTIKLGAEGGLQSICLKSSYNRHKKLYQVTLLYSQLPCNKSSKKTALWSQIMQTLTYHRPCLPTQLGIFPSENFIIQS